ncbi:MAG: AMP-binding protein, partial [Aeromicrobium sp.]
MSHPDEPFRALPADHLRRLAGRFAAGIAQAGVAEGDRVVVSLPNSVELLAAVWGCVASGRIPVPLDPRLTPHERQPIWNDVSPALVLDSLVRFADL